MSEKEKNAILSEIKEALQEVPAEHRKATADAITHDIGVMAKAIKIASASEKKSTEEPADKQEV